MSEPATLARANCAVHQTHRPSIERAPGVYTVERHHIHPREYDGPDTPDNLVYVCPTGHTAIHELLRALIKGEGSVPWSVRRAYSKGERQYAEEGYRRLVESRKVGYAFDVVTLSEGR